MLDLTPAQRDIYLEGKLFGKVVNNIGGYQKYIGELDIPRFLHARRLLLRSNDAYRLRFQETVDGCCPYISHDPQPELLLVDFSGSATPQADALIWIQRRFETPFDDLSIEVFQDALITLANGDHWYFAKAHHLIMDGWGFALQMQRFLQLYDRLLHLDVDATADLENIAYPSFIDGMRRHGEHANSALHAQSREYWLARHTGLHGVLFPPVGQVVNPGSRRVSATLDAPLFAGLLDLAAKAEANIVSVFYAVIYIYISRIYRCQDITICSPVHNRRSAIEKQTIGSFVNVNAHRLMAPPGDVSLLQLVRYFASQQKKDYRHSRFPLGHLVRGLREQSAAGGGLAQEIAFNYQKLDFQLTIDGRPVETSFLTHHHERVPLTFVLCEYGAGQNVVLHLDYATSYFGENEATSILDRLLGLLRQGSADGAQHVASYSLLTPTERYDQFVSWQGADTIMRSDVCLHEFFEEQVRRTPDHTAVAFGDIALTYAELNERANLLAHRLIELGAGPERFVGICHGRSTNLLVAVLAVLKAGAAYVPVDPTYPKARVQYILDDAQADIVLVDARGEQMLPIFRGTIIFVEGLFTQSDFVAGKRSNPGRAATGLTPSNLSYLIYTSGSTGRPKGVLIEHRNVAALIQWALHVYTLDELAAVLAATSICFDLSIFEMFVPLAAGGRVVLVDNVLALRHGDFNGLSLINTVPSVIRGLLESAAIPTSVRCINLAGELLRQELVDALYAAGSFKVYDLYGPSEDTTYSTFCLRRLGGSETIGRPIAHTQVYVLDTAGNPLPQGSIGELHIGGAGLARGYLNQPALTAEKFVFNRHADSRLYRTGDLVRFTEDGQLQYLGRMDAQIKIRGYRVELGEIESRLLQHPAVADCAVLAREDIVGAGSKMLVAYVIHRPAVNAPDSLGEPSAEALADFLGELLPAYMIPSLFVPLPELPLTPNGKLDRQALPKPGETGGHQRSYIAPRNEIERKLGAIWQTLLKRQQVDIRDSFFALGGDSLLLLRLAASIEAEFALRIELTALFENPTMEAQGQLLTQQRKLARLCEAVAITGQADMASYIDL